jgi:hypothetical protein
MFCVGVSTAFSLVSKLDKLMVAVKEVVGEQYHIHGLGTTRILGIPMESRTNTIQTAPKYATDDV